MDLYKFHGTPQLAQLLFVSENSDDYWGHLLRFIHFWNEGNDMEFTGKYGNWNDKLIHDTFCGIKRSLYVANENCFCNTDKIFLL